MDIYGSDQGGFQGHLSQGFVYIGPKLGIGWIAALEPGPANGCTYTFSVLARNRVPLKLPIITAPAESEDEPDIRSRANWKMRSGQ